MISPASGAAGPPISVVICTYADARRADLRAAVAAAQAQTAPPLEVMVVVDHNPALLRWARATIVGARVLENRGAPGLSGARNCGLVAARGAVVAFLDDDAVAAPDWLARLGAGYAADVVAGVGGAIAPAWDSGRPRWLPAEFDWVVGCTYRGLPTRPAPVRNLIGCNMSFRRDLCLAAGGFRTGVGQVGASMGRCDDTEFCIRLGQHAPGRVLLYQPAARVHHRVPAARARWAYFCARCYTEGAAKAGVARLVGATSGLAAERAYTRRTLPAALRRELAAALHHGDASALLHAGALLTGLALTVAGYLAGTVGAGSVPRRSNAPPAPRTPARPRAAGRVPPPPGDPRPIVAGRSSLLQPGDPRPIVAGQRPRLPPREAAQGCEGPA